MENQETYKKLIEEIKRIEFVGIVKAKWAIGKTILKAEGFLTREYGSGYISKLSQDLGMCVSEINPISMVLQYTTRNTVILSN